MLLLKQGSNHSKNLSNLQRAGWHSLTEGLLIFRLSGLDKGPVFPSKSRLLEKAVGAKTEIIPKCGYCIFKVAAQRGAVSVKYVLDFTD